MRWMQLHRPDVTDDRECGNLEFLCTLNTPSPERMRYLLELCKEKKTSHLIRPLLESQDFLRILLSFWEEASLSLRSSLRSASSTGEFGQPSSWPRRAAPTAKCTPTRNRFRKILEGWPALCLKTGRSNTLWRTMILVRPFHISIYVGTENAFRLRTQPEIPTRLKRSKSRVRIYKE